MTAATQIPAPDEPWRLALRCALLGWRGTPWQAGQCVRGVGVDCRFFVVGVFDSLYRIQTPLPPRLPQNMPLHDPAWAMRAMHELARRWPCRVLAHGEAHDCGDVLICRRGGAESPGHVMIADPHDLRIAWHATSTSGVNLTAIAPVKDQVIRVWRMQERERWLTREC